MSLKKTEADSLQGSTMKAVTPRDKNNIDLGEAGKMTNTVE